jgi:hypothetical protein
MDKTTVVRMVESWAVKWAALLVDQMDASKVVLLAVM